MAQLPILAERLKLFATRTSKPALLLAVLMMVPGPVLGATTTTFKTTADALKQGMSAFNGGYYEIAIPALQFAAKDHEFLAEFYLAKIYADNSGSQTDHAKAYALFQTIADEHAEIDPEDDPRAPYVGKSLTALAGYVRTGLKEIGLKPDPERAAEYLHNASVSFDDEDAQFELAKMQLKGEGVDQDIPRARHWLARLSQKGHAGAQAFLADLLWRGMYMEKDQPRALALISVSVDNAPPTGCGSKTSIRTSSAEPAKVSAPRRRVSSASGATATAASRSIATAPASARSSRSRFARVITARWSAASNSRATSRRSSRR
jgi:hypothetical protein